MKRKIFLEKDKLWFQQVFIISYAQVTVLSAREIKMNLVFAYKVYMINWLNMNENNESPGR